MDVDIWTDGSCNWKTRLGGCAYYMLMGDREISYNKGYKNTTIDRMEITAILKAIFSFKEDNRQINVNLYCDRLNVVETLKTKYLEWSTIGKFNGMNSDLWIQLFEEIKKRKGLRLRVIHIAGHQRNVEDPIVLGNVIADALADYKQFEEYEEDLPSIDPNFDEDKYAIAADLGY